MGDAWRMFGAEKGRQLKLEIELVLKFGCLELKDCQDWIFNV
jgi:hypothetical protein